MDWKTSQISKKYPTYRNSSVITTHSWLEGKREDDNAEGLWRIHDSIYDLTDFIDHHPGGRDWLYLTRGTDITELFEAHHLTEWPYQLAAKFKIRDAREPRNITLTLHENGFYMTLKSRVKEQLEMLAVKKYSRRSDVIHSTVVSLAILLSIVSGIYQSKMTAIVAGVFITWTAIVAHNYFHRRDNWRMYTFNFSLMNYKDWRVSHAMSHHMFPNSFHDLELSMFEPIFCWIPNPYIKNTFQRYGSWIYSIVFYPLVSIMPYTKRLIYSITKTNILGLSDLIPFTVPLAMFVFANSSVWKILQLWLIIMLSSGFSFALIALNAAHHHPEVFHDGDAMRINRDWGLYQIDTVIDRADLKGSLLLGLTHFGDHILHHLFPTLDHGVLTHLYPVLYQTCEEFEGEIRECSWISHICGQFRQLARTTPNPKPPVKKVS